MVANRENLTLVYIALLLVCANARFSTDHCRTIIGCLHPEKNDSLTDAFDWPETATQSPKPASDSPETASHSLEPATDSPAPAFHALEPAADALAPACDSLEPVAHSPGPSIDSPTPAGGAPAADLPAPTPNPSADVAQSPGPSNDSPAPSGGGPAADLPVPAPNPSANYPETEPETRGEVFYVTSYGAVADGKTDSSLAFLAAWDDACDHDGNSTVVVPEGTFFLNPVSFGGPCYNQQSPMFVIRGSLKAPLSLEAFHTPTWILFHNLQGLELTGGIGMAKLDAQGAEAWLHNNCKITKKCDQPPRSIRFVNISSGIISRICIENSKGFHISFTDSDSIHLHGINLTSPWNSPNTDGIHIAYSTNVNITSSIIGVGDDCVSIGPGSLNISVSNVTCGPGHGISIGSLGKDPNEKDVIGVNVRNCTIKDTTNGVRVKTWPGAPPSRASNFTFEDIVMINVSNPIILDQEYCAGHSCNKNKPSLVKLSDIFYKNIRGTSNSKPAVKLLCSSKVPCEDLQLTDVHLTYNTVDGPQKATLSVKGAVRGVKIVRSSFSVRQPESDSLAPL